MTDRFDLPILYFLQNTIKNPFFDSIMPTITHLGDHGVLWIFLTVLLLCKRETRAAGITCGAALLLGFLIGNLLLKNVIARIRPFDLDPSVEILISKPNDYSMPSGHTLSSVTAGVSILLWDKRWGIVSCILAGLIAFSRLYLFVHYPTDVIVSILLGIVIAFGINLLYGVLRNKMPERIAKYL